MDPFRCVNLIKISTKIADYLITLNEYDQKLLGFRLGAAPGFQIRRIRYHIHYRSARYEVLQ